MKYVPTKKQWQQWSLPSKLSAIGVLLAIISLGAYIIEKAYQITQAVQTVENPPPREFLLGTWEARELDFGSEVYIRWTINPDGTTKYTFERPGGIPESVGNRRTLRESASSRWSYADGLIYEEDDEYDLKARSIVKAIDPNTFELTIVDNDAPESRGSKRLYRRVLEDSDQ